MYWCTREPLPFLALGIGALRGENCILFDNAFERIILRKIWSLDKIKVFDFFRHNGSKPTEKHKD